MINLTLAIGELMEGVLSSAAWIAAEFAGELAIGAGLIGGGVLLAKKVRRKKRERDANG